MDILKILQDYHTATYLEKKRIENQVRISFRLLPDNEKKEVQMIFLKSLDKKINEAKTLIEEMEFEMA